MSNFNSNGFDLTRIFAAMKGRLGWHQPASGTPVLSSDNLSATSGRYYDRGIHKACTIQNYWFTQEDPSITDANFNQLLQDEEEGVITRVLNAVINKPQLIEHKVNYTRQWNLQNVIVPNQGQACGYRINVAPGDYAVVINSIGLFFNKAVTFNMYLFNDLIAAPVYTKSVTTVANSQTIVQLDWAMNYINTATDGVNMGGVWYILYFQKDLNGAQAYALDEQLNLWADSKIFGAYPFQAPMKGDNDFVRINPSVNFRTYGFNMEISSYRDYTQVIVENAQLFDEARLLMMSVNVLEQLKYSTRSDSTQRNTADFAAKIDLDMNASNGQNGQYPFASGLKQQLQRELERINENFWKKPTMISVPIGNNTWQWDREYMGMDLNDLPSRELPGASNL